MSEPVRPHPVGGVDYPRTFQELQAWFPDDHACLQYLARLRWPDGFVCPSCSSTQAWQTAKGRWMCAACGGQTSVTAGTIFHRIRTPLSTWFAAIWFITSQKNGMSALGLQRVLGFGSYETAWAWLHKLRRAMVRPERDLLSGVVELDEVFVGNESRGAAHGLEDNTVACHVDRTTWARFLPGSWDHRSASYGTTRRVVTPVGRGRLFDLHVLFAGVEVADDGVPGGRRD